jgi:hypothetical protein
LKNLTTTKNNNNKYTTENMEAPAKRKKSWK